MRLPADGRAAGDVLAELHELRSGDVPTHGASTMAYVYDSGLDHLDGLVAAANAEFQWTNALDPTAFPSVAALENAVVGAAVDLLGGEPGRTVGTFTAGGTESCLLAVLAARERWSARGRRASRPRLLLPVTAHAAFRKAAHLFGLDVIDLPVDAVSCAVSPAAVAEAVDDAAALVVVSAPSYPQGVLDPVAEVAAIAAEHGVPCHVDACIGGWVLPFLRLAGEPVPPFDLSVPGVTSLSVDLHKYGYAPKGASILLTADDELRRAHYFVSAGWPGYPVVNPTLAGTRPAGPLAAAWATMQVLGVSGYRRLAAEARSATLALADGVRAIAGLRVLGTPASTLLAFTSDGGPDVLVVADEMRARGWVLQPQPAHGALPPTVHLTLTAASAPRVPALLADLAEATAVAATLPPVTPDPALVAAAHQVDVAALTPEVVGSLLELAGLDLSGLGRGSGLPERMAPVHALLGVLPPALSERLLAEIVARTYS